MNQYVRCGNWKGIAFFLVVVGLVMAATGARAEVRWVDGTYTGMFEDGNPGSPYKKIQSAIGAAVPEDTVKVMPGVYEEFVLINKVLTLSGTSPDTTVIRGRVTINANLSVTIEKLTVNGSTGDGIFLTECTSAVDVIIKNVISTSNLSSGLTQADYCTARLLVVNCTFANNQSQGAQANVNSNFYNCLFTNNAGYGIRGYSFTVGSSKPNTYYCNTSGNFSGDTYLTTSSYLTTVDPLHIDALTGDYRLHSDSKCRNTGWPGEFYLNPDGSRNDKGAFGGPGAAGFYESYGNGPVVTDLHVTPGSVPENGTISITATGKAQ